MTEAEWHSTLDCHQMVQLLQTVEQKRADNTKDDSGEGQRFMATFAERGRVAGYYSRKGILLYCATGRYFWDLLIDPRSRAAIVATEQYADDAIDGESLQQFYREASEVVRLRPSGQGRLRRAAEAARDIAAVHSIGHPPVWVMLSRCWNLLTLLARTWSGKEMQAFLCSRMRDLFGNPFRPPVIDPGAPWLQDAVVRKLAQTQYDERAFDHFPVFADALEVAGCTDRAILDHCRQPGQHVRGCWLLDLVLGRELG
jgi:hypothetical protein